MKIRRMIVAAALSAGLAGGALAAPAQAHGVTWQPPHQYKHQVHQDLRDTTWGCPGCAHAYPTPHHPLFPA